VLSGLVFTRLHEIYYCLSGDTSSVAGFPKETKVRNTSWLLFPDLSLHMLPSIDSLHLCKSIQCMACHADDQLIRFR
jgi:hypothetical protein